MRKTKRPSVSTLERRLAKKRKADEASFDEALRLARRFQRPVEVQCEFPATPWEAHSPEEAQYDTARSAAI
jgi:hypothetical protein